jgi:ABC-2 type transport system permease protein
MAITAAFAALVYATPHHGTFFAVTGFVSLPVLFLSNAFVPLHAMPGWMSLAAHLNPLTYSIEAMRILVVQGWDAAVAGNLAVLSLFSLACLVIGTDQFRRQTGERLRG